MLNKLSLHLPKPAMILALSLCSSVATAAVLDPNSSIFLDGTTSASNSNLAGSVIYENEIGFSVTDDTGTTLTGSYIDTVIRSDNTNTLIFSGRIQDLAFQGGDSMALVDWSVSGYSGYQTDVEYRTDPIDTTLTGTPYTGIALDQATRDDGDLLTFDFEDELTPPDSSLFSSVATDASFFDLTGTVFFNIDGVFGDDDEFLVELTGVAAPSPVPLPAAFWMFGSGLIGLIGLQRQRRKS